MGYAFISYSSKNLAEAQEFNRLLLKNGVQTWIAPESIPAGSNYAGSITGALKNCSCLILLLTDAAQNSVWVTKEVERACSYRKPIIPMQIEPCKLNDAFEYYLSSDHFAFVNSISETDQELQKVIRAAFLHTNAGSQPPSLPDRTDSGPDKAPDEPDRPGTPGATALHAILHLFLFPIMMYYVSVYAYQQSFELIRHLLLLLIPPLLLGPVSLITAKHNFEKGCKDDSTILWMFFVIIGIAVSLLFCVIAAPGSVWSRILPGLGYNFFPSVFALAFVFYATKYVYDS